jgi:hypothetical protein
MDVPYEIVHVINATQLIDSESYQRTFEAGQAGRLQPGFYIVRWCAGTGASRYDGCAEYVGPFTTRHMAEEMHASTEAGAGASARAPVAVPALT